MPNPTNTAAVGTRAEQPLGGAHPQTSPGPGPKGDQAPQPQSPPDASTRGRQPAARKAAATQAYSKPRPHHGPPIWPTEGPTHVPSEGPPIQTCTATPTDTIRARPLGTVRPNAHNPTESPSPQAPATPSASAPAQAEPASQRHHDPPAGPAMRPTGKPSRSCPAPDPGLDPDPDPTCATVPADTPRSTDPGGQPVPTPVPEDQTREALQPAGGAATPPAPPARPQRKEATVDGTEEMGGPLQLTEAPLPAADLPREPENQRASPPVMAASGSEVSPNAGQPDTGPDEPVPDAKHAAGLPPRTAHGAQLAGQADAAPFTGPAHHSNAGAPQNAASGKAPPQGPPGAQAKSAGRDTTPDAPHGAAHRETSPGGHNCDEDSFDAVMESCRSDPHADPAPAPRRGRREPRCNHTEGTPLTVSRQAQLQRDYTAPLFFYVDQFEQSSRPGHLPMLSTLVGGTTYKRGGKVAGHGSCMAVVCKVSPVPS